MIMRCKRGSREVVKKWQVGKRSTGGPLALQRRLGLLWKGPLRSKLRDLDMQVQECQKATQRVRKIKPSDMHRQLHVYWKCVLSIRHICTK